MADERKPKLGDPGDKLDWAEHIADEVPDTVQVGWRPNIPVEGSGGGQVLGPDGKPAGIKSNLVTDKTGPEQLFDLKRQKEPCWSCEHFDQTAFDPSDKIKLFQFLARECSWQPEAIRIILDNPLDYGVCAAHSAGANRLHVTHKEASCLRLYRARTGWLKSFAGKIFGGSSRHGF